MSTAETTKPAVEAVSRAPGHVFSKTSEDEITLIEGIGVEGDAHAGATTQHLHQVRLDPTRPNLRQVHLIHGELHDRLRAEGFEVGPGDMGENVTTRGLALLDLPLGTRLALGESAVIEVTGLRNPCNQLDKLAPGLMSAVLDRDEQGELIRLSGIMAIVLAGGVVRPGDRIAVGLPDAPHVALEPV